MTGVSLRAEAVDRPIAYDLRHRVLTWRGEQGQRLRDAVVCSDVWWLSNDDLRRRPTISLGPPEINALTAFLAGRVPSAFTIADRLAVLLDLDLHDPWACCWGDARIENSDAAAVDAFTERYLEHFLIAAVERFGA